jgi:hypothetical protein
MPKKAQPITELPPIDQLPREVLQHIFSFLDLNDLIGSMDVKKEWYKVAHHHQLWQALIIRK